MAGKLSAGVLLFRGTPAGEIEVLLAHMGGPFWARKDEGAWSIPKGEHGAEEDPLAAARREFAEELGHELPPGDAVDLGTVTQSGGKRVRAFALEGDLDVTHITSNTFELEWPPRSGRRERFPEVDRAEWFQLRAAHAKLLATQTAFLERLVAHVSARSS